jgi:hypothetical protein
MNCGTTIWQVNVDRHKTNIPQYHFQDHIPLQTPALENLQNRTETSGDSTNALSQTLPGPHNTGQTKTLSLVTK